MNVRAIGVGPINKVITKKNLKIAYGGRSSHFEKGLYEQLEVS